jgi:hypothetical protein
MSQESCLETISNLQEYTHIHCSMKWDLFFNLEKIVSNNTRFFFIYCNRSSKGKGTILGYSILGKLGHKAQHLQTRVVHKLSQVSEHFPTRFSLVDVKLPRGSP